MRKQVLLILSLFFAAAIMQGQAVHYFSCVQVQENGVVHLSWESPVAQSDFVQYNIYHTTIANPNSFQLIDQITDYFTSTYIHSPTTANQQENLYYISTIQNALPDVISDTLWSIHLTVDDSDPNLAILDWNGMHVPLLAASDPEYTVWMHDHQSAFSLIGNSLDTHFEVPIAVCRDTFYFKIEIGDDDGCISSSNIFSAVFEDITPPPMPVLDSVSIDPFTGEVILGWGQSPASDAGGYVIYNVLTTINDTLAFVFGAGNTFYNDISFDACMQNRAYAMAAFDTCGNISPGSYDIPQRTILLNEIVFDPCLMINTLSWTEYINMSPSLQGYRVFLSTDGSDFSLLATLPAGITVYQHGDLLPGHEYSYFIRAFSPGDLITSSSCIQEYTTWQYLQPTDNSIENASVENNEMVVLDMLPDDNAFIPKLLLYRAVNASGPFELLEEFDNPGSGVYTYDDETAEVNSQSYYYRTELIDSCGNEVLPSVLMRTILLEGEKTNSQRNILHWNAFEGWPSGIASYELYRALNDGSPDFIGETGNNVLSFEDDLTSLSGDFSSLRYQVMAVETGSSGLVSWSNEIIFEYTPNLFLPNAFTPGGKNPVYKAVGTFAEFNEYRMDVYDRWGSLVFSSQDFGTGWDGSINGKVASTGVFVCIINYRSATGESQTLKSTFVLLR